MEPFTEINTENRKMDLAADSELAAVLANSVLKADITLAPVVHNTEGVARRSRLLTEVGTIRKWPHLTRSTQR